jgi:pSer/pThr/pTyr-binding forkhead associated (FHA) protein
MTELWLKYKNEKGEEIRLPVEQEKFAIGRHSENDLSIANWAISRQHAEIERFADVFVISDVGSSLGTKINGAQLDEPVALHKGDKIILGGEFEIEIELISDDDKAAVSAGNDKADSENDKNEVGGAGNSASAQGAAVSSASSGGSSIPTSFFYIAPLFGIVVLLSIGGILIATGGGNEKKEPKSNEYVYTNEKRNLREPTPETNEVLPEETPSTIEINQNSIENSSELPNVSTPEETNSQPSPRISSELEKVEVNSASFLRRIAQSEPRAFLLGKHQEIVQSKINQFKNSTVLADNLKSAKKNEAAIKSLASSKNLKPQFLTVAALARLGNSRGDVLQTAQAMAEVLDEMTRNIGDERSDDALLVIAAFEQGASGNALGLRNKLQSLVNESPSGARQIRTIWFLRDKNHITEAEFESALRFLAIGTISQNPKEFGVNAEAVIF